MNNITVMIKPVSASCNLRCSYCFYFDEADLRHEYYHGVMSVPDAEQMLNHIRPCLKSGDRITFAFQGGEPMLAGLDFYRCFITAVKEWGRFVQVNYTIQTNGTLLDEKWCHFFKENHFLVGISLDLLRDEHEKNRRSSGGQGTWNKVLTGMKLLKKTGNDFNVLCTLTNEIARHPDLVWKQILALEIDHVQFTPCLAPLNELNQADKTKQPAGRSRSEASFRGITSRSPGTSPWALTPTRYADFYIQIFSRWIDSLKRGHLVSVKRFDDILNRIAYGICTVCGMDGSCSPQLIIEASGNVYSCDFYCLDEYCVGNTFTDPFATLLDKSTELAAARSDVRLPRQCNDCPYLRLCAGGCVRMRAQLCPDDGRTCGMRVFYDACLPKLLQIARSAVSGN